MAEARNKLAFMTVGMFQTPLSEQVQVGRGARIILIIIVRPN